MKHWFSRVLLGLLLLSMVLPASSALACEPQCPPPPPKPVVFAKVVPGVTVELNVPEGCKQNESWTGTAVITVDSAAFAYAQGKNPGASWNYDLLGYASVNGNTTNVYVPPEGDFVQKYGNGEVKLLGNGQIQVTIPISGQGGDDWAYAYGDTWQSVSAWVKGKYGYDFEIAWAEAYAYIVQWLHMDLKPISTDVKGLPPTETWWSDIWTIDLDPDGEPYRWWKNPNWHANAPDLFVWSILPLGEDSRPMIWRHLAEDGHVLAPDPSQGDVYAVNVPHMGDKYQSFHLWEAPVQVLTWDEVEQAYGVRP